MKTALLSFYKLMLMLLVTAGITLFLMGNADAVAIAGCSAGGFGAAMPANEILTEYFPKAEEEA